MHVHTLGVCFFRTGHPTQGLGLRKPGQQPTREEHSCYCAVGSARLCYRETLSAGPGPAALFNTSDFPLYPHLFQQESFCLRKALFWGSPDSEPPLVSLTG